MSVSKINCSKESVTREELYFAILFVEIKLYIHEAYPITNFKILFTSLKTFLSGEE